MQEINFPGKLDRKHPLNPEAKEYLNLAQFYSLNLRRFKGFYICITL
jgi:hypothetical protein